MNSLVINFYNMQWHKLVEIPTIISLLEPRNHQEDFWMPQVLNQL